MSELLIQADKLRAVKTASDKFIMLWAVDCIMTDTVLGERFRSDISGATDLVADSISLSTFSYRMVD